MVKHFAERVGKVIDIHSYYLSGNKSKFIDISTVLRMIPIHWIANEIVCAELKSLLHDLHYLHHQAGIPLKSKDNPDAPWTDEELYKMLGEIYE